MFRAWDPGPARVFSGSVSGGKAGVRRKLRGAHPALPQDGAARVTPLQGREGENRCGELSGWGGGWREGRGVWLWS